MRVLTCAPVSSEKHTPYDYTKDFVVPIVLAAVTAVIALWGKSGVLTLCVGIATFGVFTFVFVRFRRRLKAQASDKAQQDMAAIFYPRFRDQVHRFEEFVDTRTNDTLHSIVVADISTPLREDLCRRLGTAPIGMWSSFWFFFGQRVDRTQPAYAELVAGMQEFHHLLMEYCNMCVAPIFTNLPDNIRSSLTERERSALNGFQQRLTLYLRGYMAFAKELSQASPELSHLPRHLPNFNPL